MYGEGHKGVKASGFWRQSRCPSGKQDGEDPPTPDLARPILDELELSGQSFFETTHLSIWELLKTIE